MTEKLSKKTNSYLSLKIIEAESKDVGRGIAKLDPEDMKTIGVGLGNVIEVTGKRATVAKVVSYIPIEERGKKVIQIDGYTRENAGNVSIGEKVKIRKIDHKVAERLTLDPIGQTNWTSKDVERLLVGVPLIEGDKIRTTYGSVTHDFVVLNTSPEGALIVGETTKIKLKSTGRKEPGRVTYEDIGGLNKEIQKVREMIELPLKFPQVFERLGTYPPKGVLLYGPPGCGKTLLAKAISNESGCYFTHITGPEIMGKFYGEAEARLRKTFETAEANTPAILFIDEIEAIAPKREEMGAEKQVERRVVAQLLSLMDGLESRGQLIVIGATNAQDLIDSALRRPGRFDREIVIGIPDKDGRLEILEIHSRGMPLAKDVSLKKLAEMTHGFVGADLEALCREAAMKCLRTIIPDIDFEMEEIPYDKLMSLEVNWKHFMLAMNEIQPSGLREFFVETPDVGWEDVGGLDEIKQVLIETIEWPLKYPEAFEHAKTPPPKGILLSGPPGTGKTLVAKAVAKESGVNFISIKGPALISKYIGESEKAVREVFKKTRQNAPCILFFDEIDSIASTRTGMDTSKVSERTISQLLTELDGIDPLRGVVVLAATNRLDIIDPAILRPGRFDKILKIPVPDKGARIKIFEIHTRGKPLAKDVDLKKLADRMEGKTGADIASVCQGAAMLAIREFINTAKEERRNKPDFHIELKHFEEALKSVERK